MINDSWYVYNDHVPVSIAAGGVVVRVFRDQLLVACVREDGYDHYILPKGSVEVGESLEEAARREILEEAGLDDLIFLGDLSIQERFNFHKTKWKIIHYFLFISGQVEGEPMDINHDYYLEWYPIDHLPKMFWPEQQEMIEDEAKYIVSRVREFLNSKKG